MVGDDPGGSFRAWITSSPVDGVVVTGHLGDDHRPAHDPTRYQVALRRQAANRVRRAKGLPALPDVQRGGCAMCGGWGVTGPGRDRCSRCNGKGDA